MSDEPLLVKTYILIDCPHCKKKIRINYRLTPEILGIEKEVRE